MSAYQTLAQIARREFPDVVASYEYPAKRSLGSCKLRLRLRDGSLIDIWLSPHGKYSYHWEHRSHSGLIYRFDNAPDHPHLSTHPHHLHHGTDSAVLPSRFPKRPAEQIRFFLTFVRERLQESP